MCCMVKHLRDKIGASHIDILALSKFVWHSHNPPAGNWENPRIPSITQSTKALAEELHQFLKQKVTDSLQTKDQRISHLEKQLAAAQSQSPSSPGGTKRPADLSIPLSPSKKQKPSEAADTSTDKAFHPTLSRPLANTAPHKGASKSVDKWIKGLQQNMEPADAKKLDQYVQAVLTTWQSADKTKRPCPKDLAAQWGLPVTSIPEYSDPSLIKVSAAAAWQVAHHTA